MGPGELGLIFPPKGRLPRFAESELLPEDGSAAPPTPEPGEMEDKSWLPSCVLDLVTDPDLPLRAPLTEPLLVDPFLDGLEELESDVDVGPTEPRPEMSALDFRNPSIFSRCRLSSILRFSSCQILTKFDTCWLVYLLQELNVDWPMQVKIAVLRKINKLVDWRIE